MAENDTWGRFEGQVRVEWQDDGREMRLLETFAYTDQFGMRWDAPAAAYIDGASIPAALWAAVGSPYTGKYRLASVVHDIACCRRERPWRDVHHMFYNACRCGGVNAIRAKVMYAAVYAFGPKWPRVEQEAFPQFTPREFDSLCEWIEENDPSIQEIDARVFTKVRELQCFKDPRRSS